MPPKERTKKPLAEQVLEKAVSEGESYREPPVRLFLPTGCAVLNCVLSDRVDGGWPCGRIVNPIGDSDTCKTVLAMNSLAEACELPEFNDYRLIYLDEEASMTCMSLFGSKVKERVELRTPDAEEEELRAPETIEELHYFLLELLDSKQPFVCVVDSFDALPSKNELEETRKNKKAHESNKEGSGSYNMSKQKYVKKMFREIKGGITDSDSMLMIVSQTIANIGSMFDPKTVAGGGALEFFCRLRCWLSKLEVDKVKGRAIGRRIKCKVTKNHITGKKRDCKLWVYERYGIQDIMTSVDFLCEENILAKLGGWIEVKQWGVKKQMKDLIKYVMENNLQDELNQMVQEAWDGIEASLDTGWGSRYE